MHVTTRARTKMVVLVFTVALDAKMDASTIAAVACALENKMLK